MPIPLGIFATAGAGGAAAGSYELISTTILSSSTATVDFTSISSSYKHLQIRAVMRTVSAGYNQFTLRARLNSDAGNNYKSHYLTGNGSGVGSTTSGNVDHMVVALNLDSALAGTWSASVIDLLDYASTTKNKTIKSLNGFVDTNVATRVNLNSALWMNTSAVTSLSLYSNENMATGSRFSLYGIKG